MSGVGWFLGGERGLRGLGEFLIADLQAKYGESRLRAHFDRCCAVHECRLERFFVLQENPLPTKKRMNSTELGFSSGNWLRVR